jgi:hypothetical protein
MINVFRSLLALSRFFKFHDGWDNLSFPENWIFIKHLIEGEKFVDSTVWVDGDAIYLLTYKKQAKSEWCLCVYQLNMDDMTVSLLSSKTYQSNIGRPAGHIFEENGKLLRPAQDCSEKYGESIILYCIDSFNKDGQYIEHEVRRMTLSDIKTDKKIDRIHTYSRDSKYEVIDGYREKLDLLHVPRIYLRSRRK